MPSKSRKNETRLSLNRFRGPFKELKRYLLILDLLYLHEYVSNPSLAIVLAHVGPRPAGLALWFRTYSTWEGRPGLWLEDLWVEPWARSRGIGRALVAGLAARAVACGWARLDLSVLDWNPARDFYDRLGFRELAAWRPYRLEGERLRALARELAATTSGDGPASG